MSTIAASNRSNSNLTGAFLKALWLIGLLAGLYGMYQRLFFGHRFAGYGSYVPWGLWVSAYIWLIGLSAGAFLLSCLAFGLGVEKLERVGKPALITALCTLICALMAIALDLGHIFRAYAVFTRPSFTSMMAWMIWLYTAYAIVLASELYLVVYKPKEKKRLKTLALFGIPLAIAFHGGVGSLFATVSARPVWHSSLVPILFLTGALVSGGALLIAIAALVEPMRSELKKEIVGLIAKIVTGLIIFDIILEWAELSIPLWYGVGHEVETLRMMLFGQYWWVFWIVHLLIGTVIPLAILLRTRHVKWLGVAGLLIATSFMAVRLNIVIPALVMPEIEGLQNSFRDHRLKFTYVPTMHEWLVLMFIVCFGIGLFVVATRLLSRPEADRGREGTA